MMNNEESPRMPYQQGRKPMQNKYYDNNRGYSNENRYGQNQGYSGGYNRGYSNNNSNSNSNYGDGQHQRRRVERFPRRDQVNYTEKLTRQNDLIIKLLKEIRDRLPAPAYTPAQEADIEAITNHFEAADHEEAGQPEPHSEQAAETPEDMESAEDSHNV